MIRVAHLPAQGFDIQEINSLALSLADCQVPSHNLAGGKKHMTNGLVARSFELPMGSIDAYLARVSAFPILSAEEERALFVKFQQEDNLQAAENLVLCNLRYVARVAHNYLGYGLPLSDLLQEGTIGLMKAVKRFDLGMGVRLATFAMKWIKSEIHEYVIKNWRIVKLATTKAQRKLFFNLRSAKKHFSWLNRQEALTIAEDLGVSVKDVHEMESRIYGADLSFDLEDDHDEKPALPSPAHFLVDENQDSMSGVMQNEQQERVLQLQKAMQKLDARSQIILQRRFLEEEKATLQELAEEFSISVERVRQLEGKAMKVLREAVGV